MRSNLNGAAVFLEAAEVVIKVDVVIFMLRPTNIMAIMVHHMAKVLNKARHNRVLLKVHLLHTIPTTLHLI
jgi:molybdenum cofactor biosynthesis enzyme